MSNKEHGLVFFGEQLNRTAENLCVGLFGYTTFNEDSGIL